VIEKGLFVTRLITSKNMFVSIPNSKVLNSYVVSYRTNPNPRDSQYSPPLWIVEVAVPTDVPPEQVYEILMNAALETSNFLHEPKPRIKCSAFKNNYMTYSVKVALHNPTLYSSTCGVLRKKILDEIINQGIILHPTSIQLDK
jgi:small-conductance mechanosensitive channel